MPRLPQVRAEELARAIRKLGFELDRQRGSHAVYLRRSDTKRVVIPMHKGTLKRGTLRGIIGDIGITVEELTELL